jgi:hypothetical protein
MKQHTVGYRVAALAACQVIKQPRYLRFAQALAPGNGCAGPLRIPEFPIGMAIFEIASMLRKI